MLEHLQALAVHAYYAGEIEAGRRACERILSTPGVPFEVAMQTRANRTWYTQTLDDLLDCRFHRIDVEPAQDGWSLFNPTLIVHGGQLLGLVRSSNYRIVGGRYVMPEADGQNIRTTNLLVQFSDDLKPLSAKPLAASYPETGYPVYGLEDCRLRVANGVLSVSATVRNVAPFDGRCRIAIAALDRDAGTITGLRVLDGLTTQVHEKNWMPIHDRGGWLYSCSHDGHVVTVDPDPDLPGGYQLCRRQAAPKIAGEFRGGSQLIPFRGGYLCLVHETAHLPHGRAYEHRWVWFDQSLSLAMVSPVFAFRERQAIEFAAGLVQIGDRLVASFGIRDAEAWLVDVAAEDVWRLLSPAMCG
jgi:hypothetical protein